MLACSGLNLENWFSEKYGSLRDPDTAYGPNHGFKTVFFTVQGVIRITVHGPDHGYNTVFLTVQGVIRITATKLCF